jgi:hypothetical protein
MHIVLYLLRYRLMRLLAVATLDRPLEKSRRTPCRAVVSVCCLVRLHIYLRKLLLVYVYAQWLRSEGAAWPTVLEYDGDAWSAEAVAWCRTEGCDSPLPPEAPPPEAAAVAQQL